MGALVNGRWERADHFPTHEGAFVRAQAVFRDEVSADTRAPYPAAPGRYRLYVSLACPWAHRTLIVRALKGLTDAIPVTVVNPIMGPDGWAFGGAPGCDPDPEMGARYLYELYARSRPDYTGRVTTPTLWDRETRMIVSNESADIVRVMNRAFDAFGDTAVDLRPTHLAEEIEALNEMLYEVREQRRVRLRVCDQPGRL